VGGGIRKGCMHCVGHGRNKVDKEKKEKSIPDIFIIFYYEKKLFLLNVF
jgi:hypothetical protein